MTRGASGTSAPVDSPGPSEASVRRERDRVGLSASEYAATRGAAINVSQAIASLPLELVDNLVATAERAQSLGPILDPTLARDAGGNLADELRLFRALARFRRELEDLRR